MGALLTTEMVAAAVESEYGSMFIDAREEFDVWYRNVLLREQEREREEGF